jgi:uncharacterized protein YdhG (YjbR/CyaY superfamily)
MKKNIVAAKNIDEYLFEFPEQVVIKLEKLRQAIKKAAPNATEAISYCIPTFKLEGNLVHFAGYKNHIGFYPGAGAIETFKTELASYNLAKGTVQFPLDKALPLTLVSKIVKFRVKQNLEKAQANRKNR